MKGAKIITAAGRKAPVMARVRHKSKSADSYSAYDRSAIKKHVRGTQQSRRRCTRQDSYMCCPRMLQVPCPAVFVTAQCYRLRSSVASGYSSLQWAGSNSMWKTLPAANTSCGQESGACVTSVENVNFIHGNPSGGPASIPLGAGESPGMLNWAARKTECWSS